MKNLKINNLVLYSCLLYTLVILSLSKPAFADTISTGGGNRIHFINLKSKSGSDAILLESNGHFGLIDMGEDYDFPDGSNPLYPDRWGISRANEDTIEDRLFRHLKQVGVKKLDFVVGTHVHSDHIGTADEVLKRFPVDRFYLKKYSDERITTQWRLWDNLYNYDNAVRTARESGVNLIQDISDQDSHFKLGDMDIQLYNYKNEYGPDGKLKRVYDDNSNSIVAVVTVAGKRIYLGGDLDNAEGAEDKLGPVIGKVDMMKWNHHYDATVSNTVDFIENLSPSIVVQTSGADINRQTIIALLREKNIKTIKAYSQTKDATVFDISNSGFTNVSDTFPDIPTVSEKWYKEDGYWKYRLTDDEMAIGWKEIEGVWYFFNGKGQMQADRWLQLKDSKEKIDGNWYYLNKDGSMQGSGWFKHDGTWYYITWSGAISYNELAEIGGQKYLFDKDGKMLTGLQVFKGKKMLFASSGALQTEGTASSWQKLGSNWYYYDEDGLRTVGLKKINGLTYYFDNNGIMQTGWAMIEGHWNYFASSGAMKTGWIKDGDTWYYLDKDGVMLTGLQEIDGTRYYLNASGAMQTGWAMIEGHWNYFASSGAMKTGWIKDKDAWYYLDKDGIMLTGLQEIDGTRYYLNASGAMQTGWKWFDNHYSYFTSSGAMKTGWLKDKDLWYYLDKDGIMLTGLQEIDGTRYYLNASGAMETGWKLLNNYYYYFTSSGAMKTGWFKDKGLWYYLKPDDGVMATGLQEIDGTRYYLNASGAMETGWKLLDNQYYYFTESGAMKTGWFKDKGIWYYLKPDDGVMATGLLDVDGTRYYLNASGAMETGWKQLNGNWYYFQADGSLLRNGTTPDGYKVNQDGIWSLNPDKVEVQGSQEDPKKDSDKPVEKGEKSAEVNEKDEVAETKQTLKADKE